MLPLKLKRTLRLATLLVVGMVTTAAWADEAGTRVSIRLAESAGALPRAEKMVETLTAAGGEHHVIVKRTLVEGVGEVKIDLWGPAVPVAEIPQSLRDAFPVLAKAEIQATTLDPASRPKLEDLKAKSVEDDGSGRKIFKKRVIKN